MDDALDLAVEDNEFATEFPQTYVTQNSGAKISDAKSKLSPSFDPNDYISLSEAKKRLLRSLEEYELKDDVMVCARGSVKSRLGVRDPGEEIEFMDYESNDLDGGARGEVPAESLSGNQGSSDDSQSRNTTQRRYNRVEDMQRRPCMNNLCKRLRVRWYDNPVKVGKELAERLEEHKFSLIIETVKTIGGKKAIELFNETKRIQLEGGMKTCNGSRRRTSGGVFLTLLKSSDYATEEQIKKIFKEDIKMKTESLKRKKAEYNKRKNARKLLEQGQANQNMSNNSGSTEQQESNIVQPTSNTVEPMSNTVEPMSNTIQPMSNTVEPMSNTMQPISNTMQTDSNTDNIVQQEISVKQEQEE